MKMSFLQGKAATIAGCEVDRAMSVFQIPGSILEIREIKVGREIGQTKKTCTVKVIFNKDLYTKITFKGTRIDFEGELAAKSFIHWKVASVVTHYRAYGALPYRSDRMPLY